jgi:hypothetical protein
MPTTDRLPSGVHLALAELTARSWRRQAPDITDPEIATLAALVPGHPDNLAARMLRAYRAGRRDATPDAQPLAGFERCPTCESTSVAAVAFATDPTADDDRVRMWARCGEDGTTFRADTGAIHPADPAAKDT